MVRLTARETVALIKEKWNAEGLRAVCEWIPTQTNLHHTLDGYAVPERITNAKS